MFDCEDALNDVATCMADWRVCNGNPVEAGTEPLKASRQELEGKLGEQSINSPIRACFCSVGSAPNIPAQFDGFGLTEPSG
jgi:hypothetical protein